MEEIKNGAQIPTFDENSFVRGVMRVRCSTPGAKTWRQSAVQYLPTMWGCMKLAVVDFDKVPSPFKVLGLFPNCDMDSESICTLLQAANTYVNASCWSILNQKLSEHGTHICFAVTEDQYAIIKEHDFKLHFGAGVASFKDLSEQTSKPSAQSKTPNDADETNDVDMSDSDDVNTTIIASNNGNTPNEQPPPNDIAQPNTGAENQMEVDKSDVGNESQHQMSASLPTAEQIIAHDANTHSADPTAKSNNAHLITDGAGKLADMKLESKEQ